VTSPPHRSSLGECTDPAHRQLTNISAASWSCWAGPLPHAAPDACTGPLLRPLDFRPPQGWFFLLGVLIELGLDFFSIVGVLSEVHPSSLVSSCRSPFYFCEFVDQLIIELRRCSGDLRAVFWSEPLTRSPRTYTLSSIIRDLSFFFFFSSTRCLFLGKQPEAVLVVGRFGSSEPSCCSPLAFHHRLLFPGRVLLSSLWYSASLRFRLSSLWIRICRNLEVTVPSPSAPNRN